MANPYPMQPQMQQQPQPQMGGGATPPRPVKSGTSKAVPVVVSAGLSIGVFCGLLFGLGIDKEEAVAATTTSAPKPAKPETAEVPAPFRPDPPKVAPVAPKQVATAGSAGSAETKPAAAGSGSDAKPAAGSGATVEKPATPGKVIGKLTITVKPEAIAKTAKIFIDGKQIDTNVYELDLTDKLDAKKNEARKSVKVLVKSSGYKDIERTVDIVAAPNSDNNNSFEIELPKRAVAPPGGNNTGTVPNRPPPPGGNKPPPPKCKKPCGMIDI
ncbi:MAG: hypothetical protein ABI867_40820 [Kofleriaceae bacterium]